MSFALGLPIVGSVISGLFNKSSAKQAQNSSQDYNTEVLQNRHQWEVDDLRAAGLNPILSATNSSGGSGIGSSSFGSMPDLGQVLNSSLAVKVAKKQADVSEKNAATEAKKVDLSAEQMRQQFKLMHAQIDNTNALTQKILSEKLHQDISNKYAPILYEGDYGIKVAQVKSLEASSSASYASAKELNTRAALNGAELDRVRASTESIMAALPKLRSDGKISEEQYDILSRYNSEVNKHPNLYSFSVASDLASGAINIAVKGALIALSKSKY